MKFVSDLPKLLLLEWFSCVDQQVWIYILYAVAAAAGVCNIIFGFMQRARDGGGDASGTPGTVRQSFVLAASVCACVEATTLRAVSRYLFLLLLFVPCDTQLGGMVFYQKSTTYSDGAPSEPDFSQA